MDYCLTWGFPLSLVALALFLLLVGKLIGAVMTCVAARAQMSPTYVEGQAVPHLDQRGEKSLVLADWIHLSGCNPVGCG